MNCKTLPFALLLALTLASCSTNFYQVHQTASETVSLKSDHGLSYENGDCRVSYDLWLENGDAGFTFYNKTTAVIYLHLDESFYVMNGVAHENGNYYAKVRAETFYGTIVKDEHPLYSSNKSH